MMSGSAKKPCPYEKAGFFSRLTYAWLFPLVVKARQGGVGFDDLFDCNHEDSSKKLGDDLQREWNSELSRYLQGQDPSLCSAVVRVFGKPYLLTSILPLVEECVLKISQAVFLGILVRSFGASASSKNRTIPVEAYWSTAGVCLATLLGQLTRHPYFISVRKIGMQVRVACCTLVCRKAMRLSKAAMGETTVGQMVNLISNDVGRFDQSVLYLPYIVIGPIQTGIIVWILWKDLGPSCLAGVSVLLLYIPYQAFVGRVFSRLRCETAEQTDERICATSEAVGGMRIIKMYTWERAFKVLVEKVRRLEISSMRKTSLLQAVNVALCIVFSKIILVICFVLYSYLGHRLTSEKVFVSLALFNHLRLCMTFFFANGISQLAESRASLGRLQTFLLLEDQEEMDTVERPSGRPALHLCSVIAERVSARWDCLVGNLSLSDVSARVKAGELLAIVGPVGSGKTSLLMALLGELQAEKGRVAVSGSLAYTSQEPWTFAGTVRQNIVFDQAFDVPKYRKVLYACALDKDVEQFSQGDLTMVGDRGVSLSGGQRARVSLARAVYADSDVYLLDDPLSAVDSAVAKHLFESCICGYLREKVRLLVTHQVQFLKSATNILVLDEGKMVALGSFSALVRLGVDLLTLEDDVKEERRNSIAARPRRGSIMTQRKSMSQKRKMSVATPAEPEGRRKSVIMSGFRKSEKMRAGNVRQVQSEVRKASVVASLFHRKSSAGRSLGDRKASFVSTASEEEFFAPSAVVAEISPFGGFVETFTDFEMLEDGGDASSGAEETSASGSVDLAVYWKYFRSGGSTLYVLVFFLALLVRQIGINGSDYWLTLWSNENECLNLRVKKPRAPCDGTLETLTEFLRGLGVWYEGFLRDGYAWLVGSVLVMSLLVCAMFSMLSMRASINLHKWMFGSVLRSKISFFDDNPVGRILNRFSKDIGIVDEILPITISDVMATMLTLCGSIIMVIIVNPWIAIPTALLCCLFLLLRGPFVAATRDVKRLEATTRSPVYSTLATAMHGITVIRAFGSQSMFEKRFLTAQDKHTAAWFAFICVSQYFGMVLDLLCGLYITAIAWVLVLLSLDSSGGNIGLAISSALVLSGTFQFGVRLSVEVENQMTSVERVLEYSRLEPEAPDDSPPDKKPPEAWPQKGALVFSDVHLSYTPGGKQILKNFNCHIQPEEKVGIVGRTGAGKSSLMLALYRMVEPEGIIHIDGIPTRDIGLHDLRSKISIIPQEPLIFTGTVKRNLDPFDEYPDPEIWTALEQVHLKGLVRNLPDGLSCELSEGGGQLSLGQRQLFCLARAILKKNKILVMDEATANIDHKTDALIQNLIKEVFRDCTVLTIAHRLNTIIDYNKILVLDSGVAAEFDEPHSLLQNPSGIFSEMARQTGWAMFRDLQAAALRSYRIRRPSVQRARSVEPEPDNVKIGEDEDDVIRERIAFPEKTTEFKHAALDRVLSTLSTNHMGIQDGDNIREEDEEDSDDVTKDDGGKVTRL